MSKVVTRYAPSPTGVPHIGNIRTALFSYIFAKNQKGKFILRIEDTDQKRSTREHIAAIKESLNQLNLNWDQEYLQSQRLNIYANQLEFLKKNKLVYEDNRAWRFKINLKSKEVSWEDLVHGRVSFPTKVLEDFIVVKSDGFPTYHLASVVDDHLMNISHVMRGDEWISSTPKHLLLYEAFGWKPPAFVHLPPILGQDHKKLSKREGAKSVIEYIGEGYLPEALINFLSLLGWSPKDNQEVFSIGDLTKQFSLDRINKNSPIFNVEKLDWFNGQWIRLLDNKLLAGYIQKISKKYKLAEILEYLPIAKDRLRNLKDFEKLAGPLISPNINVNPNDVAIDGEQLGKFVETFEKIKQTDWTKENISQATITVMESAGLSKSQALGSIGMAISGASITPPIFNALEKLGKEKTIERLENVIENKRKK